MSLLVDYLDKNHRTGENGHIEHDWSENIQEQIIQFDFQMTRTGKTGQEQRLRSILTSLASEAGITYRVILFKMIGYTRDIVAGKGECDLTYMMIRVWYDFYPRLAFVAIDSLLRRDDNTHQFGSWKDAKYFCEYCRKHCDSTDHELIKHVVKTVNVQLEKDFNCYMFSSEQNNLSLLAKWIPREKSNKFGWLYELLASDFFPEYMETATTSVSRSRAIIKCKTEYRRIISKINKALDTLQIKQCDQQWSKIDFNKVTSVSMIKQTKAFLNVDKKSEPRYPDNEDRVQCAENFNEYIFSSDKEIKGKRVGIVDFVKRAIEIPSTGVLADVLNSQWRDNSSMNESLGNMIAMVDVSGSMDGDPMHAAIGLGIRIAEKSRLGKLVITFSQDPAWVNFSKIDNFVDMVKCVQAAPWGMNTNFYRALNLILDAIVELKMSANDVKDMTLVILSDMQMDEADACNKHTLYENITREYAAAGVRVHRVPYTPPRILFWNLRSTNGFPVQSNQPNTAMMSGYSPIMLNQFIETDEQINPWDIFIKGLNNERYSILEKAATEFF
jgi:hypothetical protein